MNPPSGWYFGQHFHKQRALYARWLWNDVFVNVQHPVVQRNTLQAFFNYTWLVYDFTFASQYVDF